MLSSTLLDDFSYVTKDQAETSVLFELISARYEQRSLLITANQPFGQWDKIFPDPAMTVWCIVPPSSNSTSKATGAAPPSKTNAPASAQPLPTSTPQTSPRPHPPQPLRNGAQ